jgi:hypothetical protein
MDKLKYLIIALLVLVFLGFMHSRYIPATTTTTTSKTVVVKNPNVRLATPHYGYVPPPAYNPYKAQFY